MAFVSFPTVITMPALLPNELFDIIVSFIALKPRSECIQELIACSTANRTFTSRCQKHIFHTVSFFPRASLERPISPELEDAYRRTALLSRALVDNPSLGAHTRRIEYRLSTVPADSNDEALQEVTSALNSMTAVDTFSLGTQTIDQPRARATSRRLEMVFDLRQDAPWLQDMSTKLEQMQVKVFQLCDIWEFPVDVIPASVEALELHCADISLRVTDGEGPHQCVHSPVQHVNTPGILKPGPLTKGLSAHDCLEEALPSRRSRDFLLHGSCIVLDLRHFAS